MGAGMAGLHLRPSEGCGIEPLPHGFVNRRVVEKGEMVHPPEVARTVGGEQHVAAPLRSATGAGGLDEKVPDESTEWVAAARGDSGADRVVVYPRDEGDVTGLAPWCGDSLAPIVIEQISSVKVLDSCAASVEDRS